MTPEHIIKSLPMRIQFLTSEGLREVIVQDFATALEVSSKYSLNMLKHGKSAGDTLIYLADKPRWIK